MQPFRVPGGAHRGLEPTVPREVLPDTSDEPPSAGTAADAEPSLGEPTPGYLFKQRLPRIGKCTRAFRSAHYPAVSDRDWHDWHWQMRNRIRSAEQLAQVLELSDAERQAMQLVGSLLPVAITPYYASLLDPRDAGQPLRRTVVPVCDELLCSPGESDDPLHEDASSPTPGIVHRYPDRVLFLVHDHCATFCRYCTRSRVVGQDELLADRDRLMDGLEYIRRTPAIRDVLLSGGDPLLVSDEKLDWLLGELRRIPHVQFVRMGTKVPVVLPQRITPQLVRMLRRHHPLWLSLHFTHPDECTPETALACRRLADAGIPLGSQTVLLKGVNDDVATMRQLMHRLLMMRVRPYYLYQCDPISGSAHLRTSVEAGLEIIRGLRGWTTGYAVPTYVIDAPGGGGKIPLQPDTMAGWDGDALLLRNHAGAVYRYPDARTEATA